MSRFRNYFRQMLPWLLALLLLGWVLRTMSLATMGQVLYQLTGWKLVYLLLANGVVLGALNGRWWLTLYGQGHNIPFWRLLSYRLAAFSLSYITPGPHIGGEPLQIYFVENNHGVDRATAVAALTLDKLLELIVNFAFLLGGVLLIARQQLLPTRLEGETTVLAFGLFSLPLGLLLAMWQGWQPLTRLLRSGRRLPLWRYRPAWLPAYSRALQALESSEQAVSRFCRHTPTILLLAFGLSAVSWLAMLAEYWLMIAFLGVPLTLMQLAVTLTAARIAILLLIPGAVGVLEASQVLSFRAIGLSPELGISASLLIRARDVVLTAVGLWWGNKALRKMRKE